MPRKPDEILIFIYPLGDLVTFSNLQQVDHLSIAIFLQPLTTLTQQKLPLNKLKI